MKRGGEVGGPGPGGLQAQCGGAGVEGQAGGDVQQPVAQTFGLGLGQFAGEQQALGPGDQVVREAHDLKPDAVVLEVAKRQIAQAGVFVVADVVLDARAAMSAKQSPPSASITAKSRTTRPRSWLPSRSCNEPSSLDNARVRPDLSATWASSALPACETKPAPSDVTSTFTLAPIVRHVDVAFRADRRLDAARELRSARGCASTRREPRAVDTGARAGRGYASSVRAQRPAPGSCYIPRRASTYGMVRSRIFTSDQSDHPAT